MDRFKSSKWTVLMISAFLSLLILGASYTANRSEHLVGSQPRAQANQEVSITGIGGKCLDAYGNGEVHVENCHGRANQRWSVTNGGAISSVGQCLAVGSNQFVKMEVCTRGAGQQWTLDGTSIKTSDGKCLDAEGTGRVAVHGCHGGENQKWIFFGAQPVTQAPTQPPPTQNGGNEGAGQVCTTNSNNNPGHSPGGKCAQGLTCIRDTQRFQNYGSSTGTCRPSSGGNPAPVPLPITPTPPQSSNPICGFINIPFLCQQGGQQPTPTPTPPSQTDRPTREQLTSCAQDSDCQLSTGSCQRYNVAINKQYSDYLEERLSSEVCTQEVRPPHWSQYENAKAKCVSNTCRVVLDPRPTVREIYSCTTNADCIETSRDLCPWTSGGTCDSRVAINQKFESYWRALVRARSGGSSDSACQPAAAQCENLSPSCVQGVCRLTPGSAVDRNDPLQPDGPPAAQP